MRLLAGSAFPASLPLAAKFGVHFVVGIHNPGGDVLERERQQPPCYTRRVAALQNIME